MLAEKALLAEKKNMLAEVRVLDLSTDFGLMCGYLLAEMGADVQQWVAPADAERSRSSRHWQAYTLGKQVTVGDWRHDLRRLRHYLALADVLIESEVPGVLAGLGLDAAALATLNPRLVHVSITPFGSDGPRSGYVHTDLIVTAAAGHLFVTGSAERAPVRISAPQAHGHAAADAAVAVLIALAERESSGLGQHIDIAGQQSVTLALLSRGLDGAVGQAMARRSAYGATMGGIHVRSQFQAKDGWVLVLQGVLPPLAAFMTRLMNWVHEEGHCRAEDLRWSWGQAAVQMMQGAITAADWEPVQNGIAALVASRTKAELMEAAVARRLLVAPVLGVADVLDSEHLKARQFVQPSPSGPRPGPFARFSRSPLTAPVSVREPWRLRDAARTARRLGFDPASGAGPLAGLKVLDLFWVVAGPGATRMLADYGATVVHVESSQRLDMVRNVPPYIGGTPDPERAACHHTTNCNKLNLSLDLGTADGKAVLVDLIRWADVFTESFAPGVVARMGFDYETVKALNPRIIMISSCLMGQDGPWSAYAGYGNLAAAVSGFHLLTGHADQPPTGCFGPYTDFTSVRFNALAILGALRHRALTGEGQFIDMAQVEAALHFLAPDCLAWLREGRVERAIGNRDREHAPSGVYPAIGQDQWIAIATADDGQWQRLCRLAGFDDLQGCALGERRALEDDIDERLADWTRDQDAGALETLLQEAGIPAHRVLTTHDLASDPQLQHREHFLPVRHPEFSPAVVESARLRFSRTQPIRPVDAPRFGIDNRRVLTEVLGYDPARADTLEAAGVLR
jgi:crotonobetainyl-CoA:carnitine CoA-transferase CaiB-like acyl-CoA transferase